MFRETLNSRTPTRDIIGLVLNLVVHVLLRMSDYPSVSPETLKSICMSVVNPTIPLLMNSLVLYYFRP